LLTPRGDSVLDISDIKVRLCDEDKLKGFVSVTFDECFVIRGMKIIEGASGLFVAMPSRKRQDGTFQDVAHPINSETREWLEERVLAAFKREKRQPYKKELSPA
jgi:stage V sporulation protein G